jgi:hypothetical protein
MKKNQPKIINRYLPLRGTRRRNGLVIVDDKTGRVVRIRLQHGNKPGHVRVAICGENIRVEIEEGGNDA